MNVNILQPSTTDFNFSLGISTFCPLQQEGKDTDLVWSCGFQNIAIVKSVCLMGLFKKSVVTQKNLFCPAALPFLRSTVVLLYPVLLVAIGYIVSLAVGWNIGQSFMQFYEYRVV